MKSDLRSFCATFSASASETAPREPRGIERLERLDPLAHAEERDRLARHLPQRERSAAARIAVHLRQHQGIDPDALGERLADPHRLLPGHPVHDQEHLMRAARALHLLQLAHHRIVDLQATGGVEHQKIEPAPLRLAARALCNRDRRCVRPGAPVRGARTGCELLELVHRRRAIDVGAHQQHALAALVQPAGELTRERGLARTLKAGEQDDGRHVRRARERDRVLPEQALELVPDDPHHVLSGSETFQNFFADRPLLDPGHEIPGDHEIDIRFEQGTPNFAKTIPDVLRAEPSLAREISDDPLQSVGKRFEHWTFPSGKGREVSTVGEGGEARNGVGSARAIGFVMERNRTRWRARRDSGGLVLHLPRSGEGVPSAAARNSTRVLSARTWT